MKKNSFTVSNGDLVLHLELAEEGGYVALNPETGTTTQGESVEDAPGLFIATIQRIGFGTDSAHDQRGYRCTEDPMTTQSAGADLGQSVIRGNHLGKGAFQEVRTLLRHLHGLQGGFAKADR